MREDVIIGKSGDITATDKGSHVLFKWGEHSYHMSMDQFNSMSEYEAFEFVKAEINKKEQVDQYRGKTIDFKTARELGFCEYGIKDFCSRLYLDIKQEYKISSILDMLDVETFLEYPEECRRLMGKDRIMAKFGGVKNFLDKNRTREALNFVLSNGFISDKKLHILACDFAEHVLPIFEKEYPNDDRPRKAIELKRLWIKEEYPNE